MDIILIAATTVDGYIARNNFEVTDWSQDLSLFKKQTMGFPIIMGSHTFKTLPKELHGRKPIIVHRNDDPKKIIENILNVKLNLSFPQDMKLQKIKYDNSEALNLGWKNKFKIDNLLKMGK